MTADETESSARMDEAASAIIEFLSRTSSVRTPGGVGIDTPLLEGGLDSLGILQLMVFLGDKMHIEVNDEDFSAENFATVRSLAAFVVQRTRSNAQ